MVANKAVTPAPAPILRKRTLLPRGFQLDMNNLLSGC